MEDMALEEVPAQLIGPTSQIVESYSSWRQGTSQKASKANTQKPKR
jgi:hypothetical protein